MKVSLTLQGNVVITTRYTVEELSLEKAKQLYADLGDVIRAIQQVEPRYAQKKK